MAVSWIEFTQCPGCGFDLATGDGERRCNWGACPYLPEELDAFCPQCNQNLFVDDEDPLIDDPVHHAYHVEARNHAENLRAWLTASRAAQVRTIAV